MWEVLAGNAPYNSLRKDTEDFNETIYRHVLDGGRPEPVPATWDTELCSLMRDACTHPSLCCSLFEASLEQEQ